MWFRMITRIAVKMRVRHTLLISAANHSTCFLISLRMIASISSCFFLIYLRMPASISSCFRHLSARVRFLLQLVLLVISASFFNITSRFGCEQLSKVWHAVDNAANESSFAPRIINVRNCRKRWLPRHPDRRERKIRAEKQFSLQNTWICSREQIHGSRARVHA